MNQAYLFNTGDNFQSYKMLGARPDLSHDGEPGFRFAVWAPNAKAVSVVGDLISGIPSAILSILMAQLESGRDLSAVPSNGSATNMPSEPKMVA